MSEVTRACDRGCTLRRRHLSECEDPEGCRGCLPRRAEYGRLCWPCHRRLELMLTDAPTVDAWLDANLAAGQGAARAKQDFERKGGEDGSPAPIKVEIHVVRDELRDHWSTWVDWLCERHELHGPDRHTVQADARYLLSFIARVEEWETIADLFEQTAWLNSRAHAVAPWRPEVKRLRGVPCPECGEVNLLLFGGESDVTCGSCHLLIPEAHYGLWERIVKGDDQEAV